MGQGPGLRVGRWRVDAAADEIEADGRVVKLEPLHMRLLLVLAERAGQVVTTQELLDLVWRDLIVTSASVYQAVAQLRRQLGDSADEPEYIQTVHRKGYRLLAPVTVLQAAAPAISPVEDAPPQASEPQAAAAAAPNRRRAIVLSSCALALAAAAAGAAWWGASSRRRPAGAAALRVAVLPFVDRSVGGTEGALARGLALDVLRLLGQRGELEVVAPDSVLALDLGTPWQPADVARRLDARYLLAGDLSRAGAALVVSARLLAPPAAAPFWQQEFRRSIETVALLPQQVAEHAAAALGLAPPAAPVAAAGPSAAYELYVLGNDAWRPKTTEAFVKARDYFQRGIDLDPTFARNYVGLGWTWIGQATNGAGLDVPRAIALATPLFERALKLEPQSAEALTAKAQLHGFAGEFDTARELLQRALAVQPSYAQAHHTLGVVEFDGGLPLRSIDPFQRAAQLNPLSASPFDRLAVSQTFVGQADAALASARRAVELEPRHPNGYRALGIAGYASGDLAQAVGGYRQALQQEPRRPYLWLELGWLYLDLERPDDSAAAFARGVEQLPRVGWPAVHAAFVWVARRERGEPPPALASAPEDGSIAEWMMIRAMAGLPLDAAALQRALNAAAARGDTDEPAPWFVFQGRHRPLDLATVHAMLGQTADAERQLTAVQNHLDRLERQGNRWHMLAFHRARVLALRQRSGPALDALAAALAAGSRRAWWLRLDPAFTALRGEPRFTRLLDQIGERNAAARRTLGF